MSKRETYEARTEALLQPIVEDSGCEIYDVEYVKEGSDWYLRAYIDKEGGVDINNCEKVSRALSDKLDEEDFIEDAYILEVSSPGLGRSLKKEKHFDKSIGELVDVKLYQPVEGQKEFSGKLISNGKNEITILIQDETSETEQTFRKTDVALVRLAFDF